METNKPTVTKQQVIDAAFAHVYADPKRLVEATAMEHTIANMGQNLDDYVRPSLLALQHPDSVINSAYQAFLNDCGAEGLAAGIEQERRAWLKDAYRDVKLVQRAGLPLTLANVRLAFEGKAGFAKKAK